MQSYFVFRNNAFLLCTFCCFCRWDFILQEVKPLTMEQNSWNSCRWTNILNKNGQRKQTKHIQRIKMWNVCDNETKDHAASSKSPLASWRPDTPQPQPWNFLTNMTIQFYQTELKKAFLRLDIMRHWLRLTHIRNIPTHKRRQQTRPNGVSSPFQSRILSLI